jgi:hypothetical protein
VQLVQGIHEITERAGRQWRSLERWHDHLRIVKSLSTSVNHGGEVGFIQGILAGCFKCLERLAQDNAHVRADYGRKLELGIGSMANLALIYH